MEIKTNCFAFLAGGGALRRHPQGQGQQDYVKAVSLGNEFCSREPSINGLSFSRSRADVTDRIERPTDSSRHHDRDSDSYFFLGALHRLAGPGLVPARGTEPQSIPPAWRNDDVRLLYWF
jgi:hypothetical protein